MKKIYVFSIFLLILVSGSFFNFSSLPQQATELQLIEASYHDGLTQMKQEIEQLAEVAKNLTATEANYEQLRQQHLKTRMAFKGIEYLMAYLDQESVTRFINGAPLPKVEPKVPEVRVIEPKGLQVLDELVFEDAPFEVKSEIVEQVKKLAFHFNNIDLYQRGVRLLHRQVFESIRQELVRVMTLGVTGFDTPGSANAIPEAWVAIQSIADGISVYYPKIESQDPALVTQTKETFEQAIQYLKDHNNFENFDRLTFLKTFINPLYDLTYKCHHMLSVEFIDEVNGYVQPTNYHSTQIFSDEFFNIEYYSRIDFENPNLEKVIALGKTLFYDPIMSSTNKGSCASCHNPEKGFTDGLAKSKSLVDEGYLLRNSPTIINSVYAEKYFYDLREEILEKQMKHVVKDKKEFATDFLDIIDKLNQSKEYQALFKESYPDNRISAHTITHALSIFVASRSSFNSPFDQYVRNEIPEIDASVKRGFNLFMGKAACGTCHFAPAFNGTVPPLYRESESEVLGVPATTDTINPQIDPDEGRAANRIPRDEAEFYIHSFKTTTVRNIALTAPYMHNGVYETLEEVIDFYNKGGGVGLGLDLEYQTLPDAPLNLNEQEKQDLISFMEALTDTTGMTSLPNKLPVFENQPEWNNRTVGGAY